MKTLILLLIILVLNREKYCLANDNLLIGAFNIQNLGEKKFSNNEVMSTVKNIILRYDVILIQEIVTVKQKLIDDFLTSINRLAPRGVTYGMALSERLGRGKAKEQYAFLYRTKRVSILDKAVFPDTQDKFMRPPYMIHLKSPKTRSLPSFIAIGIHTQPSNAANETDSLVDVYTYAMQKFKNRNAIIMGDLNADCGSIRVKDWNNIRLWTRKNFTWLIGNNADTTTNDNTCAYDRIIVAGNEMKQAVVRNSAKIFDFQAVYDLNLDQTRNVSDHWPVEAALRGRA